jgi:hypothetical protein
VGNRSIYHLIDRGISEEGSQILADWLSQTKPDLEATQQRQQMVRELLKMPRFRERLYLNFRQVSKTPLRGSHLLEWLELNISESRLRRLLYSSAIFCLLNACLFILNIYDVLPPVWPATYLLYLAFYFTNIGFINPFLSAIVDLDQELQKFSSLLIYLETYPYKPGSQVERHCDIFHSTPLRPSSFLRKIRLSTAGVGTRINPIAALVLNLFTPWDFAFAFMASRLQKQASHILPRWLETWTWLEALINLADFAYLNPGYCFPEIKPESHPAFETVQLGHPLIPVEEKVCNDFQIDSLGTVILITGSNMAGKSTFVKTIGTNLCLAYAGGPVNAEKLCSLPFRLHTCIRISDSITDGFSYFYAEVKCLKRLLEKLAQGDDYPVLYLVDEIFRGTNNRERYLGSLAYIEALVGANGTGLIATHDLELAKLSQNHATIANYHFSDKIENGRLSFDYRVLPGPSQTTNALKIMEMEGLPSPGKD